MTSEEWVKWWQSLPAEEKRRRREEAAQRKALGIRQSFARLRKELYAKLAGKDKP